MCAIWVNLSTRIIDAEPLLNLVGNDRISGFLIGVSSLRCGWRRCEAYVSGSIRHQVFITLVVRCDALVSSIILIDGMPLVVDWTYT